MYVMYSALWKKRLPKKLGKFFYVISAYLYTFMELRNRVKNILYAKTSNLLQLGNTIFKYVSLRYEKKIKKRKKRTIIKFLLLT